MINEAVEVLRQGGVIIFPTETCYGLGACATNPRAVRRVFEIKKRSLSQPLSVIVSSLKMINKYAIMNSYALSLAKRFMPGPLTLIIKNKKFPRILLGGGNKIGFRIPANELALELTKALGKPITATSANIHGMPDPYEVPKNLNADFIIDAGTLPQTKPSTVYDSIEKKVIRYGDIEIK